MNQEKLMKVLVSPYVTNKAYDLADKFSYTVFKVSNNATKREIKTAVETLFNVKVQKVKTANIKGKIRHFSRITGRTKDWKKAYVRLEKGHDINFVDSK
jgi:large subunit ribosomal protein L23